MPVGKIKQFPENKISKQIENKADNAMNKKIQLFSLLPRFRGG